MSDCKRWCGVTGRHPNPARRVCEHGRAWVFHSVSSDGDTTIWVPARHDWLYQLSKVVGKWF